MNEKAPTSVHTPQTSSKFSPVASYRAHTDRFIRADLKFVSEIYDNIETSTKNSKSSRLNLCRTRAFFMRHVETGMLRIAASHCNLRWCPLCARTRRNYITAQTEQWLRRIDHPKLLTLTIKHSDDPLGMQITKLYNHFKAFRKNPLLKKAVRGGMWFFQIKRSKNSNQWHPHIHALIDSKYIPQRKLKMLWWKVSSQSSIVDIRAIRDKDKVAKYVARYAASPCELKGLAFDLAREVVTDLAGRRICGTWGNARDISLRPQKPADAGKWERFGSWEVVVGMAPRDELAQTILDCWKNGDPVPSDCNCSEYDSFISGKSFDEMELPPPNRQLLLFEVY